MGKALLIKFLKQFDYFGVQYNFSYNSKEKYRTAIGGIGFLIFLVIALSYSVIILVPLLKRETMSVIYYSMRLSHTDKINLLDHSNNFALGISSCTMLTNYTEFWDYFKLEITHVTQLVSNEKVTVNEVPINFAKCEYSDFNNELNETFDLFGLHSYYCLKDTDYTIEGTLTSDVFKYILIRLKAVDNKPETFKKIKEILKDECDFNMYILDAAFNLSNFNNPLQKFLVSQYINVKYSETMKRNTFFQLQNFASYENYLFDTHKSKEVIGAGTVDLYSVFKDNDRLESRIDDYDTFAKIYVRAELQRKIIERRYMKLTEFGANISSVLSAVLIVMFVLISFINKFYANETVMRKIFQFNTTNYDSIGVQFKNHQKKSSSKGFHSILQKSFLFDFESDGKNLENVPIGTEIIDRNLAEKILGKVK